MTHIPFLICPGVTHTCCTRKRSELFPGRPATQIEKATPDNLCLPFPSKELSCKSFFTCEIDETTLWGQALFCAHHQPSIYLILHIILLRSILSRLPNTEKLLLTGTHTNQHEALWCYVPASVAQRIIFHMSLGDLSRTKGSWKHSYSMDWSVPSGFGCKHHSDNLVILCPNRLSVMFKVPGRIARFGGWAAVWVREPQRKRKVTTHET